MTAAAEILAVLCAIALGFMVCAAVVNDIRAHQKSKEDADASN